jgi:hypothetical protein
VEDQSSDAEEQEEEPEQDAYCYGSRRWYLSFEVESVDECAGYECDE